MEDKVFEIVSKIVTWLDRVVYSDYGTTVRPGGFEVHGGTPYVRLEVRSMQSPAGDPSHPPMYVKALPFLCSCSIAAIDRYLLVEDGEGKALEHYGWADTMPNISNFRFDSYVKRSRLATWPVPLEVVLFNARLCSPAVRLLFGTPSSSLEEFALRAELSGIDFDDLSEVASERLEDHVRDDIRTMRKGGPASRSECRLKASA